MVWTRGQIAATIWFYFALNTILVSIRLYVRLTSVYRPWRELLVILAWVCTLINSTGYTVGYYEFDRYGTLQNIGLASARNIIGSYMSAFIVSFFMATGINACKAVLLLTYLDLCKRHVLPRLWWCIVFTGALLAAVQIGVSILYRLLQCHPAPIDYYWSPTYPCDNSKFLLTSQATGLATEVLVAIIPIFIIFQLENLTIIQRVGVTSMFAIGFFNVGLVLFFAVITVLELPGQRDPNGWNHPTWNQQGCIEFLQILNLPTALTVICIPQLRVFGRWKFARKVVASVARSVGVTAFEPEILGEVEGRGVQTSPVTKIDSHHEGVTGGSGDDQLRVIDEEKGGAVVADYQKMQD